MSRAWKYMLYHRYTGHISFIGTRALKIGFYYFLVIVALVLLGKYVIDLNQTYLSITEYYTDFEVLVIFFISESIIGPLPPDLFMMWTAKFAYPVAMLTALGILSYLGGIVSYKLGELIFKLKGVRNYVEKKLNRYIKLTEKWGGAFIVIAALFPFTPYATVILAVSLLKYPFNKLLIFGLFRIVRFVVQGIVLIEVLNLGN